MRRKRLIIGLVMLNILLGAAIFISPIRAQIIPLASFRDCCKGDICCFNCCIFVQNCTDDADCEDA